MKKGVKLSLVILIIVALLIPITVSYANMQKLEQQKEESFFEIETKEVSKNEKIEMTLNLSAIKYEKSIFELQSDYDIEDVEIDTNDQIDESELDIEKDSNEITIEIDKQATNLSAITFYYQIPESVQVGDTIKFKATLTNVETETKNTDENTNEATTNASNTVASEPSNTVSSNVITNEQTTNAVNTNTVNTETKGSNNVATEQQTQTIELEVTIVESSETDTEKENAEDNKSNGMNIVGNNGQNGEINGFSTQEGSQEFSTSSNNMQEGAGSTEVSVTSISATSTTMSNSQTEETVTYNGSCNNYLSSLVIDGYSLNKEFAKDNSTYFITTSDDITSLNITATAEDDDATVCIYGNSELSEGTNKILISVTAENGSVRSYRVYVTIS